MKLHDARMLSIELKSDHVVAIGFSEENGEISHLLLERVERMRGFDLREGNIVLEVTNISGATPSVPVLRKLFDLSATEVPDYLPVTIAKIEAGELTLVHIVPSYGCELIALCGRANIVLRSS